MQWLQNLSTSTNRGRVIPHPFLLTFNVLLVSPISQTQLEAREQGSYVMQSLESAYRGISSVQISSVAKSCPTLCNPMDCSMPGFPVHHQLPEFTQTHVHWVSDAIQPSHSLWSPSPPSFNLAQHPSLFQWVSSSHQVAKVLEFQLQHQSFQWLSRPDIL